MARVSLKDVAKSIAPIGIPVDDDPKTAADAGAEVVRMNFRITREKRRLFKAWCAHNDTTVEAAMEAAIDEYLARES